VAKLVACLFDTALPGFESIHLSKYEIGNTCKVLANTIYCQPKNIIIQYFLTLTLDSDRVDKPFLIAVFLGVAGTWAENCVCSLLSTSHSWVSFLPILWTKEI
jgi:hypothetical protein